MKTAILVIDVQRVLIDPAPQPFEAKEVVERINQVTEWARAYNHPVIFIQHEQPDSIIEFGSDGWKLQSGLVVEPNDKFVRKTTPDSFLNTELETILKQAGIEHLIICGYATEFCVDTTTRRAAGLGYSVDLVADAHTTHDKGHATGQQIREHHNCTLPNISSFGVKIGAIPTASLVKAP
ncbi:cysteine hydrolase family protein [Photobacterium sp. OFAV2-7]|uniref:cysteine hydrolase family protein n=1 Tax=Photobacterium sp. OFAV2-7 TaxID=2917748 RepID=UPI001EF606B6|nr:cysteine hydrolase family protein [Photobacterium sp. OFAV2-7]MCG7587764.1 cysteine hydrolase [Photobacterium sp. OFAV2-7]